MISHPLEIDYWNSCARIVGIDEAGRGPIAGPLVVAGVVFDKGYRNEGIDDSKKLSEKKGNVSLNRLSKMRKRMRSLSSANRQLMR